MKETELTEEDIEIFSMYITSSEEWTGLHEIEDILGYTRTAAMALTRHAGGTVICDELGDNYKATVNATEDELSLTILSVIEGIQRLTQVRDSLITARQDKRATNEGVNYRLKNSKRNKI
jgi:hypothetical protein